MLSCLWDGAYKEPLLLIRKSSPCGGSGFPLSFFSSLSEILFIVFVFWEQNVDFVDSSVSLSLIYIYI